MRDKIKNMRRLIAAMVSGNGGLWRESDDADIDHWLNVLVTQARNEALEEAVYAAWGALPAASGAIEEVAQAIRALKVGE